MAFYAAQIKDRIHAKRNPQGKGHSIHIGTRPGRTLGRQRALQMTHTLARMAERYKMTYRELSVALMESLPEEWRERVDPLLEGTRFVTTSATFEAQGEIFFPSLGRLKRYRFLQTAPLHKKDLLVRGPTTWSRVSDKQTQIYPEDLEHESEIVTKLAGDDATSEAMNESFGTFCSILSDKSEESSQSSNDKDATARALFPEGDKQWILPMSQDEQRWRLIIWAVSKTEYDLTLGLQLPRLEEKIATIDKTETQTEFKRSSR
jgi:hypothetical protein